MIRALLIVLALLIGGSPARAVLPGEMLSDPAQEARARALSAELRCMVCQNQSIDDSDAPLAADLRVLLRERILAGDSDEAVLEFLVARYGEFILLRPPLGWHTALLWTAPPMILLLGIGAAAFGYYRRRKSATTSALSGQEEADIRRILGKDA